MARFYFKVQFGAATIRGWCLQRSTCTHAYTPSIISLFVCTYNACVYAYIAVDPLPCGEISRAAFIGMSIQKHAARFQGRRDFEEIRYVHLQVCIIEC